jgi:hypothetical protein
MQMIVARMVVIVPMAAVAVRAMRMPAMRVIAFAVGMIMRGAVAAVIAMRMVVVVRHRNVLG